MDTFQPFVTNGIRKVIDRQVNKERPDNWE